METSSKWFSQMAYCIWILSQMDFNRIFWPVDSRTVPIRRKGVAMVACAMFMLRFVWFSTFSNSSQAFVFSVVRGTSYHRPGQSSCICVRLFRSQCNRIAPSMREHICATLDRPSVNKYWGTRSKPFVCHYVLVSVKFEAIGWKRTIR